MPRQARVAPGGYVYHALNRAVARLPLFEEDDDYDAFEHVLIEAMDKRPIRLLGYCLMPDHWHFILWPTNDYQMSDFFRWLTHTHSQRWHAHHNSAGSGHLYQGRFKAFPIQKDEHLYTALRYVEGNPLRSRLVKKAEKWRWSSLAHRLGDASDPIKPLLHRGPLPLPDDWVQLVNKPETAAELEALRSAVNRGQPFGAEAWQKREAKRLNLEHTLRKAGRPRKTT